MDRIVALDMGGYENGWDALFHSFIYYENRPMSVVIKDFATSLPNQPRIIFFRAVEAE